MDSLKVAVVNFSRLFSFREVSSGKFGESEGIEFELLKVLAQTLNFRYEIVTPKDQVWGYKDQHGVWRGSVGMLVRNEADIIVDYFATTDERFEVIDYSLPYQIGRMTFSIRNAPLMSKELVYVKPFNVMIWVLLLASILLYTGVLLSFTIMDDHLKRKKLQKWPAYIKKFLELLLEREGHKDGWQSVTRRAALSLFLVSHLVLVFIYSGSLLSFLMVPLREPNIRTFGELSDAIASGRKACAVYDGTSAFEAIMDESDESLAVLRKHLKNHPENLIKGDLSHFVPLIMDKNTAVVGEILAQQILINEFGLMDEISVSYDSIALNPIAVGFRKNFCCISSFNRVILRLQQTGIYDQWTRNILFAMQLVAPKHEIEDSVRPLTLTDIIGTFWMLLYGLMLSFAIFLAENLHHKLRK